jgi:hypothetical protein
MTIEIIEGLPDQVLGLEASGEIEDDDYVDVVLPAIEALLEQHERVRILYVLTEDFEKYEADAMWEDTKMGLHYFGKWERIGLVTDHAGYRRAITAFGFMMPGEVKVFDLAHRADAEAWVAE